MCVLFDADSLHTALAILELAMDQTGLELQSFGLKTCTTMPGLYNTFWCCSFLSPNSSQMPLPMHQASCSFSLLGKVKTKQQQQQQNKTAQSPFWVVELETCPRVWFIHSVTIPLKKADFPSPSSYQGQIPSWLQWDLVPISPSPCWDFAWFELVQIL